MGRQEGVGLPADGGHDHEKYAPGGDWRAGHPPEYFDLQGLRAAAEAHPHLCLCLDNGRRRHNYKAKFGILVGPWEQNVWLYTHLRGDTSGTARQPRIGKDDPTAAVLPPFGTGGAGL